MAICKDPQLTYLNKQGYNVVRLPRTGIEPLDVLGKDGKVIDRLGRLSQIWASTTPEPQPGAARSAANIDGKKSDSLDLSIGLKILSNILGGMGAAIPQLDFAYKDVKKVQFTFTNVKVIAVDPFEVGRYLSSGDLDSHNPFVTHYFDDEDTDAFVITEVLKSNSITVAAQRDNGIEVGVDVPAIQQAVGVKVGVKTAGASTTQVTYEGAELLTFGFKVFSIEYENGRWAIRGIKPSGDVSFATPGAGGESEEQPILVKEGRMVTLK
jgi:hypothetical protein